MLINSANRWAHAQTAKTAGEPLDEQGNSLPLMVLGMGKLWRNLSLIIHQI
ncbi:hypothetical protein P4S68_10165 [Pseudoalteromonas sp. Hal099]